MLTDGRPVVLDRKAGDSCEAVDRLSLESL